MVSIKLPKTVEYSPAERRIFDLLPQSGRPINTTELMKKFYNGKKVPLNGRTIVVGTLRSLIRKVEHNKETFKIQRSERRGPHAIDVWIKN